MLEALDHADARAAAEALAAIEPKAYRTFNLIVADNRDAFWLRHADPSGTLPVTVTPIPLGLSVIAAGDLNDPEIPRIVRYRPLFVAAPPPDPERGEWSSWERLLVDDTDDPQNGEPGAMRFVTARGFGTVSSALIALPAVERSERKPVFRFASHRPVAAPWRVVYP